MQFAKPGATEYQLEAELHHHYAMNGARHPAYGTIVGSGDSANILHYTQNDAELKDGDLVLIDSGCELEGYRQISHVLSQSMASLANHKRRFATLY